MVGMNEINHDYQLINSYGVIGDCHSVVLISPNGSVDWGCLPDFDGPAIFCRLLNAERGGYFQIAPTEGGVPSKQRYLCRSNVLQTRFASIAGEIVLTDFVPVETLGAWPYKAMKNNTWRTALPQIRGENTRIEGTISAQLSRTRSESLCRV